MDHDKSVSNPGFRNQFGRRIIATIFKEVKIEGHMYINRVYGLRLVFLMFYGHRRLLHLALANKELSREKE